MIIIIFGLPGTGKTTFATALAHQLGGVHISSDKIRHEMLLNGHYDEACKEEVYNQMLETSTLVSKLNGCVILDGTFYKQHIRKKFQDRFEIKKEEIVFIEMIADEEEIGRRVSKKRMYSEADIAVYRSLKEVYEPLEEPHLILDTSQLSIEDMIQQTINYLNIYRHGKTAYHRITTSESVP